ncbi:class I SAM-dependent methyltransferase [bacterium]|nr:class I SAM-dependent methyltransferase [bacterium]
MYCPICGGKFKEINIGKSCLLLKCKQCGLLKRDLDKCFAHARAFQDFGGNSQLDKWRLANVKLLVDRIINKYFSNRKQSILDIGFGRGFLLKAFIREGHSVWGIDHDQRMVDKVSMDLERSYRSNIIHSELEKFEVPSGCFDIAYMVHVIEHLKNPSIVLGRLYEALKPGGILLIITPNGDSASLRLFKENWWFLEDPTHYYFYNHTSMHILLESAGFKIISRQPVLGESFTLEANSALRWLGFYNLNNPTLTFSSLGLSLLFNLIRIAYPDLHPSITAIARKKDDNNH